ncbi:hypothetical protein AJ79_06023 [Helicocarpus griseus UAMH5409]|uniref:Uncharacterized protein n=1 Tax=Helicocarpus griseus UAMH5409 TaxID=1447875 RepID=A0A2B7XGT0_9EURO|nr:hypothetical protein AJ79_06023 [Helicocarpus griseus UAMH5409]
MEMVPAYTAAKDDPLWQHFVTSGPGRLTQNCVGNDMFPALIVRQGGTAAGPGAANCRDAIDAKTDTLSDAALYLFAFEELDIRKIIDKCVEVYGEGDEVKKNNIRDDFSSTMLCYRACHILDAMHGADRGHSYGPRIKDVIQQLRTEGKINENIVRIRKLIYRTARPALPRY